MLCQQSAMSNFVQTCHTGLSTMDAVMKGYLELPMMR